MFGKSVEEKLLLDFDAYGRKFGFKERTSESAIEELKERLDGKSRWFANLFSYIAEFKDRYTFTDIFIQEGRHISVARPLLPLPYRENSNGNILIPTRDEIMSIVEKFLNLKGEEILRYLLQRKSGIDFSFSLFGFGNLRCNFSLSSNGVNLTIRILPFDIPSFEESNYPEFYKEFLNDLLIQTSVFNPFVNGKEINVFNIRSGGLILHVGQTGTGKTTALASEVDYLAGKVNGVILTYENPIEYIFSSSASLTKAVVTQYDIDGHFAGSFEGVLKHLLRNTPSVAMIGEVRSLTEMESLIDIASRGHLIFATMHSSNVREALDILFSLKRKEQLANTLLAVVAHRLKTVIDNTPNGKRYRIVPFFEILLPQKNRTLKGLIAKAESKEIDRLLDETSSDDYYMSFKRHLFWLLEKKKINSLQKRELEALI